MMNRARGPPGWVVGRHSREIGTGAVTLLTRVVADDSEANQKCFKLEMVRAGFEWAGWVETDEVSCYWYFEW